MIRNNREQTTFALLVNIKHTKNKLQNRMKSHLICLNFYFWVVSILQWQQKLTEKQTKKEKNIHELRRRRRKE